MFCEGNAKNILKGQFERGTYREILQGYSARTVVAFIYYILKASVVQYSTISNRYQRFCSCNISFEIEHISGSKSSADDGELRYICHKSINVDIAYIIW